MKLVKGIYFPDSDTHFETIMNDEGNYQGLQFETALKYIKPEDRGLFIDVGAHVGLWSRMALKIGFKQVLAFEPDEENRSCLWENIFAWRGQTGIYQLALSDDKKMYYVASEKEDNSGAKIIKEVEFSEDQTHRLDDLLDGSIFRDLPMKDLKSKILIKIDVQGYEAKVVRGMKKFIQEYKPIIIVEQWLNGKEDFEATEYCLSLGMKILERVRKEVILGW